jgi:Pyruvate/2-oxoglutarate dehydrogenase complex, dihydrolipoamide acyltransferase (E2) component, and related enzymes
MKEEVKIPSVGESIVEGMLTAWLKENGDFVKFDEDLYELETEKASITVPSPFEGILEIIVPAETSVHIGQVVAMIDTSMTAPSQKEKTTPIIGVTANMEKKTAKEEKKISPEILSPSVARMIKEKEIDITGIKGTGKGGRITKEDVAAAIKPKPEEKKETKQASGREMRADQLLTKKFQCLTCAKPLPSVCLQQVRKRRTLQLSMKSTWEK